MDDKAFSLLINNNPNKVFEQIKNNKYFDYLKDLSSYKEFLNNLSYQGQYQKTINYIDYAEQQENIFRCDISETAITHLIIKVRCYVYLGDYEKVKTTSFEYINKFPTNTEVQLISFSSLGIAEMKIGKYAKAYEYFITSVDIINENKYNFDLYLAYSNISIMYIDIKEYKLADKYFNRAHKYVENEKLPSIGINKAEVLFDLSVKNIHECINLINTAIKNLTQNLDSYNEYILRQAETEKARFLLHLNKTDEAYKLITKYLPISNHSNTIYKARLLDIHLIYLFKSKKFDEFLNTYEEKKEYFFHDLGYNYIENALEKASKIATLKGDTNLKIKYLNQLNLFRKGIKLFDVKKQLNITTISREMEAKETEIRLLKQLNELKEKTNLKLNEKNNELESFASTAAHDIKAPLRNIKSFLELLKRRLKLDENSTELFNIVENSAKQMSHLVPDLLNFAKSGSYSGDLKAIDLNKVILSVEANLITTIREKEAKIIVTNELPSLNAHRSPMLQLFQNLISNSIKFTNQEIKPVIEISYINETEFHLIKLSDNGIGIPSNEIERIFKPLVKLHSQNQFEGSGLGLATCQKIVQLYNGEIIVESIEGKGSNFIIKFYKDS